MAYYYVLKREARNRVAESLNNKIKETGTRQTWDGITLGSINQDALTYSRIEWPKYYSNETHFGFPHSWERLFYRFANRPSFFDIAVWQRLGERQVLQGLALGKPSNGKTHLVIHWVERNFGPDYVRSGILWPVLACAFEYARLLGAQRLLIKDPVESEKYERYGFTPWNVPKASSLYLGKEVDHG